VVAELALPRRRVQQGRNSPLGDGEHSQEWLCHRSHCGTAPLLFFLHACRTPAKSARRRRSRLSP
jgi:hypothetical protein